jgi:hypothetical protein
MLLLLLMLLTVMVMVMLNPKATSRIWSLCPGQGDQMIFKKLPNFSESSPNSLRSKIYNKAWFKSPKFQHQNHFRNLITSQQTMFWNSRHKVAQNVTLSLGYFISSKNHNEVPKVAQLAKNRPIWSPFKTMEGVNQIT